MKNDVLALALSTHKGGDIDRAMAYYSELLKSEDPPLVVFLNYSSILRQQGKIDEAVQLLNIGTKRFPRESGIWNNLGNCLIDAGKTFESIAAHRRSLALKPSFVEPRLSLATQLCRLGFTNLAYATALEGYRVAVNDSERKRWLIPLIEIVLKLPEDRGETFDVDGVISKIESMIVHAGDQSDPAKNSMILTQLWIQKGDLDKALKYRENVLEDVETMLRSNTEAKLKSSFRSSWHAMNWNLSIFLLKQGRLKEGWQLYDHGLQVTAEGPQKWQRSLKKPFSASEIRFWKGEELQGKNLLLLGEQGIGDSMMFATLIPRLVEEGAKIFFLPGDRLYSMYKRSMPFAEIIKISEISSGSINAKIFDYQSPIGSVCQYRFHSLDTYASEQKILSSNTEKTRLLRDSYSDGRPLVGISWQGGGKASRVPLKSISLMSLQAILQRTDIRFVSLQYGHDGPHVQKFNNQTGCQLIHDESIDPVNDIDGWLSQVDSMDAVLSIANTTIHGAGGLGKPTFCLVSNQSDWRWINPTIYKGCYWYSSVETGYQAADGSWDQALNSANRWLDKVLQAN